MTIIGCGFHPSFQQIAMVDTETGEHTEKRLTPSEAVQFYGQLKGQVVVGMEGCGNTLWFERLLASLSSRSKTWTWIAATLPWPDRLHLALAAAASIPRSRKWS